MDNIIIGTAGHIDHGKTTLIKALTGRNTDTLEEEQKRGISINLGFTYFDLPSGKRAGIIDVPGHERFIKNMIAGAVGIDIVLVAVSANEGVKPQTIEHLDILKYLDIKEAVFVMTKSDLSDEVMKEIVCEDIEELKKQYKNSALETADIIEVDSVSKKGIDKLIRKIDELAEKIQRKSLSSQARLNIDRVFSLKGFGTIVTGTLSEGKVSVGDELMLYPSGAIAKIRNVQVHEQNVESAYEGQRTALNISNLKVEEMERGNVLAKPGSLCKTSILDVKVNIINHIGMEIQTWTRVRVYLGSDEVLARLVPLDKKIIKPGEDAYCQLRMEDSVIAKRGDKFVLRLYSPLITIGGGIVLDTSPAKHSYSEKNTELIEALKLKEQGDEDEILEEFILTSPKAYVTLREMEDYMSKSAEWVKDKIDIFLEKNIVCLVNNNYFHKEVIKEKQKKLIDELEKYHEKYNLRLGIPKEEIRDKILTGKNKNYDELLKIFQNEKIIKLAEGQYISLYDFEIVYKSEQVKIKNEMEQILLETKFTPPGIKEITKNLDSNYTEVLNECMRNIFVQLDDDTVIHKKHYENALFMLKDFINKNGSITLAEFRDLILSTRKYAVLILDAFDKNKITMREGDKRILL